MTLYFDIKIIHALSALFLFGGSLFIFFYCLWAYAQQNKTTFSRAIGITGALNISLIGTCGILQFISGFYLVYLNAIYFSIHWFTEIFIAYGIAGMCWLCGIHLLGQCQQTLSTDETSHYCMPRIRHSF